MSVDIHDLPAPVSNKTDSSTPDTRSYPVAVAAVFCASLAKNKGLELTTLSFKCGLRVCHRLGNDTRELRSNVEPEEGVDEVIAGHGGSGGTTKPCVSLCRGAGKVHGAVDGVLFSTKGGTTAKGGILETLSLVDCTKEGKTSIPGGEFAAGNETTAAEGREPIVGREFSAECVITAEREITESFLVIA